MKLTQMQQALSMIVDKGAFTKFDHFNQSGAFQLEVKSYIHKTEIDLLQKQFGFKSWEISLDGITGLRSKKDGSFFVRFDW
jgi:hypothetical protein